MNPVVALVVDGSSLVVTPAPRSDHRTSDRPGELSQAGINVTKQLIEPPTGRGAGGNDQPNAPEQERPAVERLDVARFVLYRDSGLVLEMALVG
jgi:hypothetical protein